MDADRNQQIPSIINQREIELEVRPWNRSWKCVQTDLKKCKIFDYKKESTDRDG